jgi:hypothetical protein
MRMMLSLSLSLLVSLVNLSAVADQNGTAIVTHSAEAAFSATPEKRFSVSGLANKLAAATAAQNACAAQNPPPYSREGFCELVTLDQKPLTTVAEMLRAVPQDAHPLFLWRYQHNNATVYLAGSVHILKSGLYPLPTQYQSAFEAADNLVLEVDMTRFTPAQLQAKTMQYALLGNNQQLPDVLDQETFAALNTVTAQYGLPLAQLGAFKPGFVTQQLAVLALMSVGYDPSQGVETYFTQQAGDKQLLALETLDFQLDLLLNQPLETQIAMVRDTLAQMDQFEPFTAELVIAWLSGDDAGFYQAFEAQSGASQASQDFMHALLDKRNSSMAEKIASYLNSDETYFVIAGAAHYIGENSIIERLKSKGFTGTRVYSNQAITP